MAKHTPEKIAAAFRKVSAYINSAPDQPIRNARKMQCFQALYCNKPQEIMDFAERLPGTDKVDYNGEHWKRGFDDGKAGRPCVSRQVPGLQPHIDYVEGWLMGDAEKDWEPEDADGESKPAA